MNTKRIKLILISFISLFILPVLAQEKIKEGSLMINNRVYSVSKSNPKYKNGGLWIRYNAEFIQDPKHYPNIEYKLATTETLNSAVIKVLEKSRIVELSTDKNNFLLVNLYPDYTGKIKAMEFRISVDNLITMEELDRICSYIEKNVSFKMLEPVKPDQKILPFTQRIRFADLLKEKS